MTTDNTSPRSSERTLGVIINRVRNRWRTRHALGGLTLVLAATALILLVATFALDAFRFAEPVVIVARIATYLSLAALAAWFLLRPLLRRIPDERVALYLEEHEPALGAVVVSALEVTRSKPPEVSRGIAEGLVRRAVDACQSIEMGDRVERRKLRDVGLALAGVTLVGSLLLSWAPPFLENGLRFLLFPWGSEAAASPYQISVQPGDTELIRGADLAISARIEGFRPDQVELLVKASEGAWNRRSMSLESDQGSHGVYLFDLAESIDYYVEADGLVSATYHVGVVDRPEVRRISMEYRYPAYTGLETRSVEDGGPIMAPQGTTVGLEIEANVPVAAAALVLDDRRRVPLQHTADGAWSAELRVEQDATYQVVMEAANGEFVPASPGYPIRVLEDNPPSLTFTKPARDTKVTSVEEPHIEIKAADEIGLERVELVYSVNDSEPQTIRFEQASSHPRRLQSGHTFYLEELHLEPGDLVTYHARALDHGPEGRGQEATTDIFFMEIRPFRRDYREAEGGGGMPGGQQQDDGGTLSAQQKSFVVAAFKMIRDKGRYSEESFGENLVTLADAEAKILERAYAISRRLGGRAMLYQEPAFARFRDELEKAIPALSTAQRRMRVGEPEAALTPARKALQHLQRADAAFVDVRVALQTQSNGGQGTQEAEDLANLFRLELDKLRNPYESVQRGQPQTAEKSIDEVMERLRELARRQQREIERARKRMATNSHDGASGSQNELADEVEELARKLERLSRQTPSPEVEQTLSRLRDAAEAMRRAAKGEPSESLAQGAEAMRTLRVARELLNRNQGARLGRGLADLQRQTDEAAGRQEQIAETAKRLSADAERERDEVLQVLADKDALAEDVRSIERNIARLREEAGSEQAAAADRLAEAAQSIRSNELLEAIRRSKRALGIRRPEEVENVENDISSVMAELQTQVAGAAAALGESQEQRLAGALEQLRDLIRDLASLQELPDNQGEDDGSTADQEGGRQPGRRPGEKGQPQTQAQAGGGVGAGGGSRRDGQTSRQAFREQIRGEINAQRRQLEDLGPVLSFNGASRQDIDEVLQRLEAIEQMNEGVAAEEFTRQQMAALEKLQMLEYALRQQTEQADTALLSVADLERVPAEFRPLVEEYYRSLSRSALVR